MTSVSRLAQLGESGFAGVVAARWTVPQVADAVGVPARTVHWWVTGGLVDGVKPRRGPGRGHKTTLLTESFLQTFLISAAKHQGLTIPTIKKLLQSIRQNEVSLCELVWLPFDLPSCQYHHTDGRLSTLENMFGSGGGLLVFPVWRWKLEINSLKENEVLGTQNEGVIT